MKPFKRAVILFAFALTTLLYIWLALTGYKSSNINLSDFEKMESYVVEKGTGTLKGAKNRKSKVFFIRLADLDIKLGVYRIETNYSDLIKNISIGDKVTAYYRSSKNKHEFNIDLIQLEKGNQVVIDKSEYEQKEGRLIYIGIIAALVNILVLCWSVKKKLI